MVNGAGLRSLSLSEFLSSNLSPCTKNLIKILKKSKKIKKKKNIYFFKKSRVTNIVPTNPNIHPIIWNSLNPYNATVTKLSQNVNVAEENSPANKNITPAIAIQLNPLTDFFLIPACSASAGTKKQITPNHIKSNTTFTP